MIDFVGIIFAILIVIGGIIGYVRASSVISLASGIVFGLSIGAGAWFNSLEVPVPFVQLAFLSALIIVMMVRLYATRTFMPAGMIMLLSVGVMVWTYVVYGDYLCVEPSSDHRPVPANATITVADDNRKLE